MIKSGESPAGKPCDYRFGRVLSWVLMMFLALGGLAPAGRAQSNQPVTLVSVMVLYTPQAAAGAGGISAMLRQIDQAVLEANVVFQNSRINARVYLVKAAGINYTESGTVAGDLARLRNPRDQVFAQAHQWRDQYAADLVCLVTETGNDWDFYGLQGPSADNAYSILRRPYLTGLNYFPVALSFNFGCQLERGYADSAGAFPYAYGYSFWDNEDSVDYSTVEAFSGQRLPFFSNPDIQYEGIAAGVPAGLNGAADNALVINQTAPIVAAFRGTAQKTLPPAVKLTSPTDGAVFCSGTNLPLAVKTSDADGSVVSVDYYYDGTNQIAPVKTAPFNLTWLNVPVGRHTLTAVATDNQHAVTVSDPVNITVLPVNDNFASRSRIAGIPATLQEPNDLATAEAGEPDNLGGPALHSLWWTWTPPVSGTYVINLTSNSLPLNLTIYTGSNFETLAIVASNSILPGSTMPLWFQAAKGTSYQLAADGQNGATGNVAFILSPLPSLPNDAFTGRTRLTGKAITIRASNQYATHEPGEPEHAGDFGNASLWWSWTAPADGQVTITATSDSRNTVTAAIYTGNALTNLSPVASEAFYYYYESSLVFAVQAGVTYQIAMDNDLEGDAPNYTPYPGPFTFNLDFITRPPNDDFRNRTTISGSWISLTNSSLLATLETNEPVHRYGGDSSIWWSWTAPAAGVVTLSSATGQGLDVYTGNSLTILQPVPLDADATFTAQRGVTYAIAASGGQGDVALNLVLSTVKITSPASGLSSLTGQTLLLTASTTLNDGIVGQIEYFANGVSLGITHAAPYRLNWKPSVAGDYTLTATVTGSLGHQRSSPPVLVSVRYPNPANDNFARRTRLQGTWLMLTNSNLGATVEPGEPEIAGGWPADSLWWQWTAPVSGLVTLSTTTSDSFGVYTGTALASLTGITNGFGSVTFDAVAGTTYDLAVVGPEGDVALKLSLSNLKIISPADGATFTNGSTISLQVLVTSTETPVRQVEYFTNGTSLGIVTNAPYAFAWTNVPGADYVLLAVATDTLGHDRSSPPVSLRVHPFNDDFADRTELQGTWILVTNSTANAAVELGDGYPWYGNAQVLWWQWTAPLSGWVTLSSPDSGATFEVYTGDSLSGLTPVASGGGDVDSYNIPGNSPLSFAATTGTTYDIKAIGFGFPFYGFRSSDTMSLQLVLAGLSIENPVSGQRLSGGTNLLISTTNADGGQSLSQIEFFENPGDQAVSLGVVTNPPYSFVWTNLPLGNYKLTAVGTDNQGRPFPSEPVAISVAPANDLFANRMALTGIPLSVQGTTYNASNEVNEPTLLAANANHTVWYAWTAPISGEIRLSAGSTYYSSFAIGVYTGDALTNLELVTSGFNTVMLSAVAGTTYQIGIGASYVSYVIFDDNFTLNLSAQPTNDFFAAAMPMAGTNITVTGDDALATQEPGEPLDWQGSAGNSVWYSWTAPGSGVATVTLSPAGEATCGVYTGDMISNLTMVASVTPYLAGMPNTFTTVPGTTYWIAVADGPGQFSLNLNLVTAPDNDFFANRTLLSGLSFTVQGTTRNATTEPGEPYLVNDTTEVTVWYAWTAPADGYVRIQTSQAFLGVFSGTIVSNLTLLASSEDYAGTRFDAVAGQTYPISVAQFPGAPAFTWSLQMAKVAITNPVAGAVLPAGTNLEVDASTIDLEGAVTAVAFYADTNLLGMVTNRPFSIVTSNFPAGEFVLSAQATDEFGGVTMSKDVEIRVSPTNDNFARRTVFTGTSVALPADNSGATTEPGEFVPEEATGRTLWWSWTAPTNGLVTIYTPFFGSNPVAGGVFPEDVIITEPGGPSGSFTGPLLDVYTGSTLASLNLYASNATSAYGFWYVAPSFTFPVAGGQTYQISLDGANGSYGATTINFSEGPLPTPPPIPVNDNFAQRTSLVGGTITTNGTTVGATLELGDPDLGDGLDARTVWYTWTAPASSTVFMQVYYPGVFSTPPQFGIYAGSTRANLVPVASSDFFNASFYALAGTVYQIEVATPSESEGSFILDINAAVPPTMSPTNAVRLANGSYDIHVVGAMGQSFVIQMSFNRRDWTTIHTDTLLAGAMDYIDAANRFGPARYYRVLPLDTVLNNQPFKMLAPKAGLASGFALNFTGTSGQPFLIQTSTNLVDWFNLSSGVLTNNAFNFMDYDAPNFPQRFYRSVPQ